MDDSIYDHGPIECRECGAELETIERGHLQSQQCTSNIQDVDDYRREYPDAPTRSLEMLEKIRAGLSGSSQ